MRMTARTRVQVQLEQTLTAVWPWILALCRPFSGHPQRRRASSLRSCNALGSISAPPGSAPRCLTVSSGRWGPWKAGTCSKTMVLINQLPQLPTQGLAFTLNPGKLLREVWQVSMENCQESWNTKHYKPELIKWIAIRASLSARLLYINITGSTFHSDKAGMLLHSDLALCTGSSYELALL